jgi:hypothetical protein
MASSKKKNPNVREQRQIRIRQIIFSLIALMIILTMVIGLFVNY